MDEHVRRAIEPLLDAWSALAGGDGSVSLLDLSRLCDQAADELDASADGIRVVLRRACADLAHAYSATARAQHPSERRRILEPVLVSLAPDLAGQTFCDWCYGPLSEASVTASRRIGLDAEGVFACDRCIATGAYWNPPECLEDGAEWPANRLRPAT